MRKEEELGVPTGARSNLGAAQELLVASDLIRMGYYVFRAVGPHGPFDLVAYRNNVSLRVEVRTTTRHRSGRCFPVMNPLDEADIYAYVLPGEEIEYQGDAQMPCRWSRSHPHSMGKRRASKRWKLATLRHILAA